MSLAMPETGTVRSLARGLDILERVARAPDGIRLSDLADAMAMKAPTVHGLVKTLVAKGYLARNEPGPRYVLGPALPKVTEGLRRSRLRREAERTVRHLFESLRSATITYAEPVAGDLAVRLRMSPERPGVLEEPADRTFSPYTSASSLVYMAFCTEDERQAVLRRYPFEEYGAHAWGVRERLDAWLMAVRSKGCSGRRPFSRGETLAVAAPVFGPGRETVATLGASAPLAVFPEARDQESLETRVKQAARELSEAC